MPGFGEFHSQAHQALLAHRESSRAAWLCSSSGCERPRQSNAGATTFGASATTYGADGLEIRGPHPCTPGSTAFNPSQQGLALLPSVGLLALFRVALHVPPPDCIRCSISRASSRPSIGPRKQGFGDGPPTGSCPRVGSSFSASRKHHPNPIACVALYLIGFVCERAGAGIREGERGGRLRDSGAGGRGQQGSGATGQWARPRAAVGPRATGRPGAHHFLNMNRK